MHLDFRVVCVFNLAWFEFGLGFRCLQGCLSIALFAYYFLAWLV